jgi:hypothetical protein
MLIVFSAAIAAIYGNNFFGIAYPRFESIGASTRSRAWPFASMPSRTPSRQADSAMTVDDSSRSSDRKQQSKSRSSQCPRRRDGCGCRRCHQQRP